MQTIFSQVGQCLPPGMSLRIVVFFEEDVNKILMKAHFLVGLSTQVAHVTFIQCIVNFKS